MSKPTGWAVGGIALSILAIAFLAMGTHEAQGIAFYLVEMLTIPLICTALICAAIDRAAR